MQGSSTISENAEERTPRSRPGPLSVPGMQIVLWTACVAANGGATEGHKYLQRETVSLPTVIRGTLPLASAARSSRCHGLDHAR